MFAAPSAFAPTCKEAAETISLRHQQYGSHPAAPRSVTTFFDTLKASLKAQVGTWVLALLLGILALFSDKIVGSIKFALNRADLRANNYEQLSTDLSSYVFQAELCQEFFEHNWTTNEAIGPIVTDYNTSIVKIRSKEFVYRSWVTKYWGAAESNDVVATYDSIRKFDAAVHSINDGIEAVTILKTAKKMKPDEATEGAKKMKAALGDLHENVNKLLTELL